MPWSRRSTIAQSLSPTDWCISGVSLDRYLAELVEVALLDCRHELARPVRHDPVRDAHPPPEAVAGCDPDDDEGEAAPEA